MRMTMRTTGARARAEAGGGRQVSVLLVRAGTRRASVPSPSGVALAAGRARSEGASRNDEYENCDETATLRYGYIRCGLTGRIPCCDDWTVYPQPSPQLIIQRDTRSCASGAVQRRALCSVARSDDIPCLSVSRQPLAEAARTPDHKMADTKNTTPNLCAKSKPPTALHPFTHPPSTISPNPNSDPVPGPDPESLHPASRRVPWTASPARVRRL